jgi:ABC-type microcin C transport system permease subunit YejB
LFFAAWVAVSIYIFSSGKVAQCQGSPYACIDWDVGVKRSLILYLFGLFWYFIHLFLGIAKSLWECANLSLPQRALIGIFHTSTELIFQVLFVRVFAGP